MQQRPLPIKKFAWDLFVRGETRPWPRDLDDESGKIYGRLPQKFVEYSKGFFQRAKAEKKPFFLNVNSYDPHRPFVGEDEELQKFGRHSPVNRIYWPDEIVVPGFLPDLPKIRVELAQYFTSVHRLESVFTTVNSPAKLLFLPD